MVAVISVIGLMSLCTGQHTDPPMSYAYYPCTELRRYIGGDESVFGIYRINNRTGQVDLFYKPPAEDIGFDVAFSRQHVFISEFSSNGDGGLLRLQCKVLADTGSVVATLEHEGFPLLNPKTDQIICKRLDGLYVLRSEQDLTKGVDLLLPKCSGLAWAPSGTALYLQLEKGVGVWDVKTSQMREIRDEHEGINYSEGEKYYYHIPNSEYKLGLFVRICG